MLQGDCLKKRLAYLMALCETAIPSGLQRGGIKAVTGYPWTEVTTKHSDPDCIRSQQPREHLAHPVGSGCQHSKHVREPTPCLPSTPRCSLDSHGFQKGDSSRTGPMDSSWIPRRPPGSHGLAKLETEVKGSERAAALDTGGQRRPTPQRDLSPERCPERIADWPLTSSRSVASPATSRVGNPEIRRRKDVRWGCRTGVGWVLNERKVVGG